MKTLFGMGFVDVFVGQEWSNHARFLIRKGQTRGTVRLSRLKGVVLSRAQMLELKAAVSTHTRKEVI